VYFSDRLLEVVAGLAGNFLITTSTPKTPVIAQPSEKVFRTFFDEIFPGVSP
jgi:hypothetical protein